MSGLRTGLVAFALLASLGTTSRAQGVVPGGWAAQFGYQTFGGPGVGGASFSYGYGAPSFGAGVSPFGSGYGGGASPFGMGVAPFGVNMSGPRYPGPLYGASSAMPMTANATDPLVGAIRQSVRRSKRR